MASDAKIICFRHCCSKSIFCKNVPKICPICRSCVVDYIIEPFLVPYPYSNAKYEPTSIVVRPSEGTFLNDYHIADDLHIGITNSDGIVFEYDKEGLIVNDCAKWTNCIAINIIPSSWENHWNETLKLILKDTKWKSENYHEMTMNCFNFVVEFINNLQYMNVNFVNKETMCDKLILPKLQDAIKYNSLFKQLKSTEFFIS
ncbi:MKRN2 opposite strand protein [Anthophora retusa]